MDTGESARISGQTIAQGMSMFGFICGDYTCVLSTLAHKAAGAAKHPAFPAPSLRARAGSCMTRAKRAAGMRMHVSNRRVGQRRLCAVPTTPRHGGPRGWARFALPTLRSRFARGIFVHIQISTPFDKKLVSGQSRNATQKSRRTMAKL